MVTDGETTGGAKSYFFWSSLSASPPSWWMFCFRRRSMDSVQQTWKETPWKKIEICDSKGQSKEFILVVTGEEGSVSAHPYVRPGRNLIVASWFFFLWAQTIWLTQGGWYDSSSPVGLKNSMNQGNSVCTSEIPALHRFYRLLLVVVLPHYVTLYKGWFFCKKIVRGQSIQSLPENFCFAFQNFFYVCLSRTVCCWLSICHKVLESIDYPFLCP